jgi:hypothetical protein
VGEGKAVDFIEASLGLHLGLQSLRLGITSSSDLSMICGEGGQTRVRRQPDGPTGKKPLERDTAEHKANPDRWRYRAEEARARAGVLRSGNIKTALLSIAEGFERLGSRAQDEQRAEPPRATAQADAVAPSGPAEQAHTSVRDGHLSDRTVADTNLADTFRIMETLTPKPQPPAIGLPDRIERVSRALCQADGRDPDRSIETGQWETVVSGGLQTRRPVTASGLESLREGRQAISGRFGRRAGSLMSC